MRELKFRAWDGGELLENITPVTTINNNCFPYPAIVIFEANGETDGVQQVDFIEQYTGLKDKNGKEIYEGDIVEASIDGMWSTGRNTVSFGKAKWKLVVIYNDIRFMDVFKVIGSRNAPDRIYYLFDKELSELEVIGNIHENPELLEEKRNAES